jgi:DNA-binding SARP family transcriptional activator
MGRFGVGSDVPGAGSTGRVRLSMLGGFKLAYNGEPLELRPTLQRLLAFVALRGHALQRTFVAGALWPDSDEPHAAANLRSALWRLRQLDYALIEGTATHVALVPGVTVDLHAAVAQAERLLDPAVRLTRRDEDLTLLIEDLLPAWFDNWLVIEREQMHQLRVHALERLAEHLLATGRPERTIQVGILVLGADPLRETAHRLVIRAHLAEENRGDALRQYRHCERLFRYELGIDPSPATRALVADLACQPSQQPARFTR